jgi:NAD(P)-dependent dehydrogenase (short-subunit alcohol dehydrogenase family)
MRVLVADIDHEAAMAVAAEIPAGRPAACAARVDATERASLRTLREHAVDELGGVNLLVSTVGAIVDRPLDVATEDDWAWLMELNLMAQIRAVDEFLPVLRAADGGAHIMLTASMGGLVALPPEQCRGFHSGIYTVTKHALVGYCDMLRLELEPEAIGVSVLCPTRVQGNLEATSVRYRPNRFGGPLDPAPERGTTRNNLLPAEAVGPLVVRAIKANRFFVFTHPDTVELVEERHQSLLEDAAFGAPWGVAEPLTD